LRASWWALLPFYPADERGRDDDPRRLALLAARAAGNRDLEQRLLFRMFCSLTDQSTYMEFSNSLPTDSRMDFKKVAISMASEVDTAFDSFSALELLISMKEWDSVHTFIMRDLTKVLAHKPPTACLEVAESLAEPLPEASCMIWRTMAELRLMGVFRYNLDEVRKDLASAEAVCQRPKTISSHKAFLNMLRKKYPKKKGLQ
jgi:hypothetical protein